MNISKIEKSMKQIQRATTLERLKNIKTEFLTVLGECKVVNPDAIIAMINILDSQIDDLQIKIIANRG